MADKPVETPPNHRSSPPHPHERKRPLPWHKPKGAEDDARAPAAVEAILSNPSYREADDDIEFLQSDSTRGLRLQLDYLKTESVLRAHQVAHTIVVFGGTRIVEPQAARREVQQWTEAAAVNEADSEIRQRLAVARRVDAKSRYYEIAREFGRIVGSAGATTMDGRIMIMTGGGPGIMEAANRGAHDVGAKSIGLNISLPKEQFPNPYVTPGLCFSFHYFAIRKLHFLMRARALVAFPGGYGTLDELFEVLSLAQTRKMKPVPVILVGEAYWRRVFDAEFLVDEGVIDPEDRDLFWFAESADDIWHSILAWHDANGTPLLTPTTRMSP
jgi:uncharacterized protein (TIGR00730 family)